MMTLTIAWRNVWRRKGRSIVIICSVIVGLWAGLAVMSFYFGFAEERVRSAIELEVSHLQIHHPEFKRDRDVRYTIPAGDSIVAVLRVNTQVQHAAGRLIARGMIASATGNSGVQINGIAALDEDSLTQLRSKVIVGSYFPGTKGNEMLIGKKLSQKLKVRLGSKLVITTQDKDRNIASSAFRVAGIFQTKNTPFDETNVFARRADVAAMLGDSLAVTEIAVLLHSQDSVESFVRTLKSQYPTLLVESWRTVAPEMGLIISVIDQMMYIIMAVVLLALAFGIVNTMLMAVLERTREIGMLIALGMKRRQVFAMIVCETFFLVLIGTPFGMLIAWASISYFGSHGIDISAFQETLKSFGYSEIVYTKLAFRHYWQVLILVILTALLSALLPARRALRLQPAEAIRR
ncbi:MAG: FtsX-like permease family protein [Bacteroidota bacterium]|nr:FtsX-like permease family protein [Bacteroidota bacterium]MDP4234449.1 FtsX-like permease family protein [Bacteroidota bacterium]MDP4243969.1 FtsX-like permease family protein [Bacteroidota bacterium]MDP4288181.1 FtsX-like permease family protein [Bacteroidota bacterium]